MISKKKLEGMKLSELRELFKDLGIKSNSVKGFITKLEATDYFKSRPVKEFYQSEIQADHNLTDEELYEIEKANRIEEQTEEELGDTLKHIVDPELIEWKSDKEKEAYEAARADIEAEYPDIYSEDENHLLTDTNTVKDEEKNLQAIKDNVPDYFNKALSKETGCECWEDNMIYFFNVQNEITGYMQDAIIKLYFDLFGMRLKRTMCSPCLRARIDKVKKHFLTKFKVEIYG